MDPCTIMPSSGQNSSVSTAPGESDTRKAPIFPTAPQEKASIKEVHLKPTHCDVIQNKKNHNQILDRIYLSKLLKEKSHCSLNLKQVLSLNCKV